MKIEKQENKNTKRIKIWKKIESKKKNYKTK